VGRQQELRELEALLAEERILALVGPVGAGKSTLAHGLGLRRLGGRKVVHLACDEGGDPIAGLAAALGCKRSASPAEAIRDSLAARRRGALIILDGLEVVPPSLPVALGRWLDASPRVSFIITSTRFPPLPQARCWETPPLDREDGVELLIDRATRQGAEGWSSSDRRQLQALVERLDGSPLALVLAAGRSRTLRPRQLLTLLERGLDPLRGVGRDRHTSAEAAARWVWDRLRAEETELLELASVFEGGFPLDALERLLPSTGTPALDLLTSLRNASALRLEGERYRIPEPIRWYAAKMLEQRGSAHAHEARRRQAAHCLSLFSEHPGDDEALPTLTRERANLLAAHRFGLAHDPVIAARTAQALGRIHAVHGPAEAEEAIKDAGVEAARLAGDPKLLARLLRDRAIFQIRLGRLAEARIDLDEFETLARASGDRLLEAQAILEQGRLRFAQGEFETAQILFTRAIEMIESLGPGSSEGAPHPSPPLGDVPPPTVATFLLGYSHNFLGMVREAQGHLEESASRFEAALDRFRRAGNRRYRAIALMNLGVARYLGGELDQAVSLFEQAIAASRSLGDRAGEADALVNLGSVLLLKGNLGEAERHLRKGLEFERELGNLRATSMALGNLGIAAYERGELRTAEELLRSAVDTARLAGERNFWAHYLGFHAAVIAALGDRVGAAAGLASARSWFQSLGDPGHLATVEVLEASLHLTDPAAREERLAAVRALVAESGHGSRSAGIRLASRLLDRAIALRQGEAISGHPKDALLEIGPEIGWFRLNGATVDLGKRLIARRILRALLERRLSAPGVGVPVEHLAAEGWPDDRASAATIANRVYVAVNTMRRLGLHDAILRRDDGYLLDPALDVRSCG